MKFIISFVFSLGVIVVQAQVSTNDKDSVNIALTITNTGIHGKSNGPLDSTNVILGTKANNSTIVDEPRMNNTLLGIKALYIGRSGTDNLAIGNNVLLNSLSRKFITAIGMDSHLQRSEGNFSTSVGYATLRRVSGEHNAAFGTNVLMNTTQGMNNTGMGTNVMTAQGSFASNNTGIGSEVLYTNNSAQNITIVGYAGFRSGSYGSGVAALGAKTFASNSSADFSEAIGASTLDSVSNITGGTAIGADALVKHKGGNFNVAIGYQSLAGSTKGKNNVSVGVMGQLLSSEGEDNVSIGTEALRSIVTSRANVAVGDKSLYTFKGGSFTDYNVAVGYTALYSSSTAISVVGIGAGALFSNTTGSFNAALGNLALQNNTTGQRNTAIGYQTLMKNTTGYTNTAIGAGALLNNTTATANTAIGIASLYTNSTGSSLTAIGDSTLYLYSGAGSNIAIGENAGYHLVSGSNNAFLGSFADATGNVSNATAVGARAIVNASNKVRIGDANVTVIEGQVPFSNVSDRRQKENIFYTNRLGVDFVMGLKTASYQYISDKTHIRYDGFIAQDIEKLMQDLNIPFSGLKKADDGTYSLAYSDFIIPLVNARKAQQAKLDDLKKEMKEVQKELLVLLEKLGTTEEINQLKLSDK